MIVTAEIEVNPGPAALFVAEVRVEKHKNVTPKWWGLWFAWWLLKDWRRWLWEWEGGRNEDGWFTWQVQLLGFRINWQLRKGRY